MKKIRFTDARDYQILFLSLFLFLGAFYRDWSLDPLVPIFLLVTCLSTQAVFSWHKNSTPFLDNWKSPVITALGISLLLRSNSLVVMIVAGILAISSKFLFQVKEKHWFNPANFGIVCALLFSSNAWVSPGQWGQDIWYGLLFLSLGGIVLQKVGRIDTSIAFLGSYALLLAARDAYLGWTWDVFLHQMTNGSLLVFALFMITDPRSIPNAKSMRILWSVLIAGLTFLGQFYFYISEAAFYALFLSSFITIFLDRWIGAPRFQWTNGPLPNTRLLSNSIG